MNINQQSEIEELFRRIKKSQAKNPRQKVSDEDMNKVRAFVVQSQRPLQAVRLLQKEREEREVDEKFTTQKEDIIQKAKTLDEEAKNFVEKQNQMTAQVTSDIAIMVKNQLKRKKECEKSKEYENKIINYKEEIETLIKENQKKEQVLVQKQQQLKTHKQFTDFLERVVKDKQLSEIKEKKSGEAGKGDDTDYKINWLRNQFINLKNENKKLKERKRRIDSEMEAVVERERQELLQMTNKMYQRSQDMQKIQNEIEKITEINSKLEQDFENQVDKTNRNIKEAQQIVNAIDSVYMICTKLAAMNPKGSSLKPLKLVEVEKFESGNKKEQEKFVFNMIQKLTDTTTSVSDLKIILHKLQEFQKSKPDADARRQSEAAKAQKPKQDSIKAKVNEQPKAESEAKE